MHGSAWVFGDEINTDTMAPGAYFKEPMEVMAQHCLEAVDPDFAANVKAGDIVIAGNNFGVGSAREQAPMALVYLGVGAILAESFSRIFYRNAINFGLPLLIFPQAKEIKAGQLLEVNVLEGVIANATTAKTYKVEGIPEHLMHMVDAGGLMPWLKEKYEQSE
ncbi:MAG: 3-isopropylmalate dehydratase [Gammaproteobacteria bacterium]|nr:3-isopropylmalate dehydratase [Gammaproteobacteria bacterium]MCP4091027.1 3-isopropylmalate dehydratase [Gammaproteobacteria bacterium]MCP4277447.1 3-isopropylmalate dehydratase [Gammaproteobacteria bacterium]MCP4831492.1 3-isopropylmalate dehydratase [Gammaproteobacteria bacterium]MCP4927715.1 3-isopropylmalate dehydratase [Gammaproteobacteria bacterium]